MQLSQMLNGIVPYDLEGPPDPDIGGLTYDSRQVKPGVLFIALRGYSQDGHAFINNAIQNGAVAVVGETFHSGESLSSF